MPTESQCAAHWEAECLSSVIADKCQVAIVRYRHLKVVDCGVHWSHVGNVESIGGFRKYWRWSHIR
ncbi:unnamed protein product [Haemonchus placei]|uniref:SRCR domain-containing protein n=1 Tax=Haemonchus placei TaxID=6290 RepID=A0A158QR80_HAEPC|nr:unnamed protein product [Haemonchus placei]